MAYYDSNFLIREIDIMGDDASALEEASEIIQEDLARFEEGRLTDYEYECQLKEAYGFVEQRKVRIPYEPGI